MDWLKGLKTKEPNQRENKNEDIEGSDLDTLTDLKKPCAIR